MAFGGSHDHGKRDRRSYDHGNVIGRSYDHVVDIRPHGRFTTTTTLRTYDFEYTENLRLRLPENLRLRLPENLRLRLPENLRLRLPEKTYDYDYSGGYDYR